MKTLVLTYSKINPCSLYRILYPYEAMNTYTNNEIILYEHEEGSQTPIPISVIEDCDCVVMHSTFASIESINVFKSIGKKVIVDVDDYPILPKYYGNYRKGYREEYFARLEEIIINADIITTTTDYLKQQLLKWNKNIIVSMNFIYKDTSFVNIPVVEDTSFDILNIGYTGGASHTHDIEHLTGLNKVLYKEFGDKYRLHLFKGNDKPFQEYVKILSGGEYRNIILHDVLPLEEFYNIYKELNICIAPLKIDVFNKCKSDLKILEALTFNCIPICSDILPYRHNNKNIGLPLYNNTVKGLITGIKYVQQCMTSDTNIKEFIKYDMKTRYNPETIVKELANNLKIKLNQ